MSDFFEPPPPPPEPAEHRQPEWIGPPDNVLGGSFPLSLVLARTDDVAVAVSNGSAYPSGFTFSLAIRIRTIDEKQMHGGPIHHWHMHRELDDDVLRFGIRFPDGSKATIFDGPRHYASEGPPAGPVLMQRGGGGGGRSWNQGFWVWPLPPRGPFAFVCEWPAHGIAVTEVELDTAVIHDAAAQAMTLWPDDDGPSSSGGTVFTEMRATRRRE